MAQVVTPQVRINHKVTFMSAHIINAIILFIRANSEKEFYNRTGYSKDDLIKMVNYQYDFSLDDISVLGTFLNLGITIVTDRVEQPKDNDKEE